MPGPRPSSRLVKRAQVSPNPGELRMLTYVPAGLPSGAPLVVALHGCGQSAEEYAVGAGWLEMADRHGFALLCPEQTAENNPNRCFNWFQPEDVRPGSGEVASIRRMVEVAITAHGLDRRRVFVTGLSAGGAMTSALLAAYPQVFAGGAIVAGLPYRTADSVQKAMGVMFQPRSRPPSEWGDLVRDASGHDGPWPKVSIWHGDADATVRPGNADEITKQWADLNGLDAAAPTWTEQVDGQTHAVWTDADGEPVIERYTIAGLGHGVPLATRGKDGVGKAGPFLLEAGISSSGRIAEFWGLSDVIAQRPAATVPAQMAPRPQARGTFMGAMGAQPKPAAPRGVDIEAVIVRALTNAGLMRP